MKELEVQQIADYELWDGVYDSFRKAKENISLAHKQIVEYAKVAGWPEVCIGEDDLKFYAPGAWKYFLENKPDDYDLYLSSIYVGDIKDGTTDDFCGMTLYFISERFYDTFLNTDPDDHIDRSLKGKGRFVVCDPFIACQYDGHSGNTMKDEKYERLMEGRNLFKG